MTKDNRLYNNFLKGKHSNKLQKEVPMVTETTKKSTATDLPKTKTKRKTMDKETRDRTVIELYRKGLSCYKIADMLHIHRHTVTRILEKNGIGRRTIGDYHAIRHEKIIELFENGKTTKEIAKEMNITEPTVVQVLERYRIIFPKNDRRLLLVAKYLELKHQKMSKTEIAKELGVNIKQLNRLIFNSPINISNISNKKYLAKPISQIIMDYLRGAELAELCKKYEIKEEDLDDLLTRFGLIAPKMKNKK